MPAASAAAARIAPQPLPAATETGALGIYQLKRLWARTLAAQQGQAGPSDQHDRHLDYLRHPCLRAGAGADREYLSRNAPSFEEFERWIVATTGGVDPLRVARINAAVAGTPYPDAIARWLAEVEASAPVLQRRRSRPLGRRTATWCCTTPCRRTAREAATQALWDHLGARADAPATWYRRSDHGIMVQYFQHPAFEANRRSARLHKAFAQLWGSADLWTTTDRVGFNVPERAGWQFPGPDLHWDVSVKTPIPFGTGGILYLTDTPPEQGAFTLVPGFQRWGEDWLESLPPGADPRQQDLHALGAIPIGGQAGDLVIWHQALPHGASPNRGERPRMVQYINMFATQDRRTRRVDLSARSARCAAVSGGAAPPSRATRRTAWDRRAGRLRWSAAAIW